MANERAIRAIQAILPRAAVKVRMDSAFFSDTITGMLNTEGVEFTVSVPFEHFTELKRLVEGRRCWRRLNDQYDFFETRWKPKRWHKKQRFVFIRTCNRQQQPATR